MDCTNFRRHHAAWREGRRASLDEAMLAHVAECSTCAAFDRALRVGVAVLKESEIEPSPGFAAALEAKLRQAGAASTDPLAAATAH